ncbi:MAG TPA: hypothetical protein VFJ72_11955 [Rubrobacteraceae bacterium]|nr:hypothetical protein [Rubrobacteraceae bacterium]
MTTETDAEYTYLEIPPSPEMRGCIGLVMAGMAARAKIGVGGLDEAVEILESLHSEIEPTVYRFSMDEDRVVAQIEDPEEGASIWRTVVELVS